MSLFCIVISFLGHGTVFFAVPNSFFSTTQDLLLVANELSILAVGTEPARQDIENIIRLLFKTIQIIYIIDVLGMFSKEEMSQGNW